MRRLALVLSLLALSFGGASVAPPAEPVSLAPVASAKPCSRPYVHAVLPSGHKCLRTGQFCVRKWERHYHSYGFHCHRYYATLTATG